MVRLNKLKIIFIILSVMLLSSCVGSPIEKIFPDRPNRSMTPEDDASVEFQQGWKVGCEVGMSAGSNTFYKMFYRNNAADGYKMTSSGDYKTAWGNAFWYCYRHDYIKQKSSIWGSYFTGLR